MRATCSRPSPRVAGTMVTDCSRARPTSVLQIHGTADASVPYNGGPGKSMKIDGSPRVDGPPVPVVNAAWRAISIPAHHRPQPLPARCPPRPPAAPTVAPLS